MRSEVRIGFGGATEHPTCYQTVKSVSSEVLRTYKLTQPSANACVQRSTILAATQNCSRTGIGRSHSANDTFTPRMPRTLLNRSRNSRETITGGDLVVRLSHTYQKDITPSGSNVYSFWQCACACAPSQTPGSRHAQKTVSGSRETVFNRIFDEGRVKELDHFESITVELVAQRDNRYDQVPASSDGLIHLIQKFGSPTIHNSVRWGGGRHDVVLGTPSAVARRPWTPVGGDRPPPPPCSASVLRTGVPLGSRWDGLVPPAKLRKRNGVDVHDRDKKQAPWTHA
ncbi:uncharacterized protein LACBIDRAFT_321666 [Laccaria bicolor S238N-H82]|uniref:Predicted protein n=1 Tax=Laccaria bicolor (strain S238N-H82 / ATCC MYA-4686) TaxID=486041 RepID=B0CTR2_LACBS|nr:uncharacterized protein LACBIDRAFT_321666 [Laccaria bicolor S238N-H82]EDR14540.1 predicted protein [Laccaria bicolor S238N-H82]|eukprot:XP_001875099.1 predicted protein [Laccaria bicolor S238N-H82]